MLSLFKRKCALNNTLVNTDNHLEQCFLAHMQAVAFEMKLNTFNKQTHVMLPGISEMHKHCLLPMIQVKLYWNTNRY